MDDDKLKNFFDNYTPALGSDRHFMNRLSRTLDAIEAVKAENTRLKALNRYAAIIGAIAGFAAGMLLAYVMPYLGQVIASMQPSLPSASIIAFASANFKAVAWVITAGISVVAALNAYSLSATLLRARHS